MDCSSSIQSHGFVEEYNKRQVKRRGEQSLRQVSSQQSVGQGCLKSRVFAFRDRRCLHSSPRCNETRFSSWASNTLRSLCIQTSGSTGRYGDGLAGDLDVMRPIIMLEAFPFPACHMSLRSKACFCAGADIQCSAFPPCFRLPVIKLP